MNRRVLFLVTVLSLSLLTWSFAALGASDDGTANVNITVNEYVKITPLGDQVIDHGTINPVEYDAGNYEPEEDFKVETNHTVTARIYPMRFGLAKDQDQGEYFCDWYDETCEYQVTDDSNSDLWFYFWFSEKNADDPYDDEVTLSPGVHGPDSDNPELTIFSNVYVPDITDEPKTYEVEEAVTITIS